MAKKCLFLLLLSSFLTVSCSQERTLIVLDDLKSIKTDGTSIGHSKPTKDEETDSDEKSQIGSPYCEIVEFRGLDTSRRFIANIPTSSLDNEDSLSERRYQIYQKLLKIHEIKSSPGLSESDTGFAGGLTEEESLLAYESTDFMASEPRFNANCSNEKPLVLYNEVHITTDEKNCYGKIISSKNINKGYINCFSTKTKRWMKGEISI
ncbi:MAG: hypothetical protein ACPGJV_13065 [Bacteriovoracaceae bacterium]